MSELINNRDQRIETMRHVVLHLHRGGAPDEVRARLAALVRETDATEIAEMEQRLIASGIDADQIRAMCDLHAEVLGEIVAAPRPQPLVVPGHPVDTFRRENRALGALLDEARGLVAALWTRPDDADARDVVDRLREITAALADVDKHYARKENLLFSCLERHGITGPSQVMWAKDDEARAALRELAAALREPDTDAGTWKAVAAALAEPALAALSGMIDKEERILLPMALETLTAGEWAEIWRDSPRYGWCLVEPQAGYRPVPAEMPATPAEAAPPAAGPSPADGTASVAFESGILALEQLKGIFAALPVDLTFVDADDRVAFFSEGPDRVFPRSRAIIGRQVQNCHPPKSVHMVEQILSDFRAGRQSVAEFWIELRGRMVHIRYFAVRGGAGEYLGTLEVTQDITHARALSGERRLLEYASQGPV